MIELTEQQVRALEDFGSMAPRLVNPTTNDPFVLIRVEEYERLKEAEYDDIPWTREELESLASEVSKRAGWEAIDESDDAEASPRTGAP